MSSGQITNSKERIELVNIFRPSEDVPHIVEDAIRIKEEHGKLKVIWTQLGIYKFTETAVFA